MQQRKEEMLAQYHQQQAQAQALAKHPHQQQSMGPSYPERQ